MDLSVAFMTLIVFALLLAAVAGFAAARVLMHAAKAGTSPRGGPDDH